VRVVPVAHGWNILVWVHTIGVLEDQKPQLLGMIVCDCFPCGGCGWCFRSHSYRHDQLWLVGLVGVSVRWKLHSGREHLGELMLQRSCICITWVGTWFLLGGVVVVVGSLIFIYFLWSNAACASPLWW